jgi:uncharacterized protein YndB with AHSA1/START domain
MTSTMSSTSTPVRKSVTVKATAERAFRVFTAEFDSWWPREHHVGQSPLERAVIETHAGGRCYGRSVDGSEADWGKILVWEPPQRFVIAWQLGGEWKYDPDLAKASEVEVMFTPQPGGVTRVDLEHRYFERHGAGAEAVRTGVGGDGGWGSLLQLFAAQVERNN